MRFERILVPVDFSELSKQALVEAVALAGDSKLAVTVLHVHEHFEMVSVDPAFRPERGEDQQRAILAKLREDLQTFVEPVQAKGAQLELRVEPGNAVYQIVDASASHDLVVMATHGRRGIGQFLLGSVTERVVRGARCSALVVRPRGAD